MSELLAQTENNIRAHALFRPNQFMLVAVSGGLDSMVLLHVLCRLADRHGWMPGVLHFNHQLRGKAADEDEQFVRCAAAELGLKCIAERANVSWHARLHKQSIEMAGRELRHDFFAQASTELGVDTVALAHHADDQVELFFLRLLRGSSGNGLAGMDWMSHSPKSSQLRLVRPFLNVHKLELQAFANAEKISYREDATNAQLDHDRNRVRHELLPLMRSKYQPALDRTTLRLMEIVGAEADFVRETARRWRTRGKNCSFDQLHVAVQREVLRMDLLEMEIAPEFELIERLRCFPNDIAMVRPELTIWRDRTGRVKSRPVTSASFRAESTLLDLSGLRGEVDFGGVKVVWRTGPRERIKGREPGGANRSESFDAERVGATVCLRHWRPGDRFQPIGMNKPVKVQDLFTNRKIPREQRRDLVLATTANGEIFWVEGLRISERFKLVQKTASVLVWRWMRD